MSLEFKGVLPAILTPFTADDKIDFTLFAINLDAQVAAGVDGIILGGSLGEASVLSFEEKEQLVVFAVNHLEDKIPVILNIAESSTSNALELAQLALDWGAKGLMLLPPMRYKADDRETVQYFKTIAAATSLPIMIYNNPVDYKIDVTIEMFEELAECANITAVKESTRDITNITRMINKFGQRYKILCGVDTLAMEALIMGGHGWVAGLVDAFPRETVAIYRLVKAGRIDEATSIYRWFMPLLELDLHPKLVQYIKLAATATGIGSEFVRAPRLTLVGAERERILAIINHGLATRPELPEYLNL